MKIAIATDDKTNIAERFGRGAGFIIYNSETGTQEFINNTANAAMGHGAGVQTSKLVVESGAEAIIGPHFGPSAFYTLKEVGVKIYYASGTIEKAIEDFKAGKLEEVVQANVQSHHGTCKYK